MLAASLPTSTINRTLTRAAARAGRGSELLVEAHDDVEQARKLLVECLRRTGVDIEMELA